MTIIRVPPVEPQHSNAFLSTDAAAAPGIAAAGIGKVMQAAGDNIAAEGFKTMAMGFASMKQEEEHANINHLVQGTRHKMEENFATRVQQQYDENGNPLYDSLRNDVAEFNKQQMEELLATLPPGKVRDEVIYRLRELDHDLQMKTVPITEGWKGEFVKAQGNNEINDLVKTYVTEADRPMGDFDAAFDAIMSKYPSSFSSEELKSMREKARSGAAAGRYEVIINSSIHSNDGETLKKVYNDIEHDPYVSVDDKMKLRDASKRAIDAFDKAEAETKELEQTQKLFEKQDHGGTIFSKKDVNKSWEAANKAFIDKEGRDWTMEEQLAIVLSKLYNNPPDAFIKNLQQYIHSSDPDKIRDVYQIIKEKAPQLLTHLDEKDITKLREADVTFSSPSEIKFDKDGNPIVPPKSFGESIKESKEGISGTPAEVEKQYRQDYKKIRGSASSDDRKAFVKNRKKDIEEITGTGWFWQDDPDMSAQLTDAYDSYLEEGYVKYRGDMDKARQHAKSKLEKVVGKSGFTDGDTTIFPIEQTAGASEKAIRSYYSPLIGSMIDSEVGSDTWNLEVGANTPLGQVYFITDKQNGDRLKDENGQDLFIIVDDTDKANLQKIDQAILNHEAMVKNLQPSSPVGQSNPYVDQFLGPFAPKPPTPSQGAEPPELLDYLRTVIPGFDTLAEDTQKDLMEKAKAAQPPAVTSEGAMILPEADDVLEPYKKELEEQEANIAKDLDALKEQSQSAVDTRVAQLSHTAPARPLVQDAISAVPSYMNPALSGTPAPLPAGVVVNDHTAKAVGHYLQQATNKNHYVYVDWNRPESQPRMFVVDARTGQTLFATRVAHGRGSGGGEVPTSFSNRSGSNSSPIGAMLIGVDQSAGSKFAYSRRLKGLEKGVNDNVDPRSVTLHSMGSGYGKSLGCFGVPDSAIPELQKYLTDGTLLYAQSNHASKQLTASPSNSGSLTVADLAEMPPPQRVKHIKSVIDSNLPGNQNFAAVALAMALLESGAESKFGRIQVGSGHLFNIKTKGSDGFEVEGAVEFLNGEWTTQKSSFRKAKNLQDSVNQYIQFMKRKLGNAVNGSVDDILNAVVAMGYATDPRYKAKLSAKIRKLYPGLI